MKTSVWAFRTVFVIFWVFFLFVNGCTPSLDLQRTTSSVQRTTKKIARNLITSEDGLRKTIGIALFKNRSYYTRENVEKISQKTLIETLEKSCPSILIVKPGDRNYPKFLANLPQQPLHQIDNLALVMAGRQFGLDAIATGAVIGITGIQEKRGIFWFREDHSFIDIQIHMEVFDTETGAKLVDENLIQKVEVDESDTQLIKEKRQISIVEIVEAIEYIAAVLGDKICDAMRGQDWKSFIISKAGKKVIISSGKEVGLVKGTILEVYNAGKMIRGIEDQWFFLPGPKTGEVEITNVHPYSAEAVTVTDNGIQVGSAVKLRD